MFFCRFIISIPHSYNCFSREPNNPKITYRETGNTIEHKSEKKKAMSDSTAYMIASVLQFEKAAYAALICTGLTPVNAPIECAS